MLKLGFTLLGLLVTMGLGILIMIFGWGIEPVSWGWIIGGGFGAAFIGGVISACGS